MSDREALDAMLGDMAGHQTNHVGEVTPGANVRLAVPLFERLDQQRAEADRKIVAARPTSPVPEVRVSDIEAKKRGWTFDRSPELPAVSAPLSKRDQERADATLRRLSLLLSKVERGPMGQPSWADRVKALLVMQVTRASSRTDVARQVNDLIAESEIVFGSIHAERARKVYVG